jgi:gluconate 2-dehydrogenase gamma chain
MDKRPAVLTRRKAIQGAASLIGGTIAAAQLGPLASRAALAQAENSSPIFFDAQQFSIIERVVDLIIPETDTPGARAAGAHHLIDLMMAEWASSERQGRYVRGLEAIDERARIDAADDFRSIAAAEQLSLLQALDREAHADDSPDTFFREFKKLVLFGYYSSEAGATVELRFDPIPGDYEPCVPIEDPQRAWFWLGYGYGL